MNIFAFGLEKEFNFVFVATSWFHYSAPAIMNLILMIKIIDNPSCRSKKPKLNSCRSHTQLSLSNVQLSLY